MDREVTPELAEAVKQRRAELKLSHVAVAGRGGPSSPILTKIEGGKGIISDRTVERLEDALEWGRGSIDSVLRGGEPIFATSRTRRQGELYSTLSWDIHQGSGKTDSVVGDVFLRYLIERLAEGGDSIGADELARVMMVSEEYQLRSLVDRIAQLSREHQLEVSRLVDRLLYQEVDAHWEQAAADGDYPGAPRRPDTVMEHADGTVTVFEAKRGSGQLDREAVRQQLLAYAARLRPDAAGNPEVTAAHHASEHGDPEGPAEGA